MCASQPGSTMGPGGSGTMGCHFMALLHGVVVLLPRQRRSAGGDKPKCARLLLREQVSGGGSCANRQVVGVLLVGFGQRCGRHSPESEQSDQSRSNESLQ